MHWNQLFAENGDNLVNFVVEELKAVVTLDRRESLRNKADETIHLGSTVKTSIKSSEALSLDIK